jgi:hypothetical protein
MKLASGTVLTLAAVASSPALWDGLVTRELPVDLALTRYLVAALAVWVGLSLLGFIVGDPAAPVASRPQTPAPAEDEPATEPSEDEERSLSEPV